MSRSRLDIVILGTSITSSQSSGEAATYRGLMRELVGRGHHVLFLERVVSSRSDNCDLAMPPYGITQRYSDLIELKDRFRIEVREADLVVVGSSLPEGAVIGEWVTRAAGGATAFYDFNTSVTLSGLKRGEIEYISYSLIPRYDLYLSFTGGPVLEYLELKLGAPMARPLYCSVDPEIYYPETAEVRWDLGYWDAEEEDCRPQLECMMLEPALRCDGLRMVVAGGPELEATGWPSNIQLMTRPSPDENRRFYNSQRFTLNLTHPHRLDRPDAGYSPNARLFEAAACSTPIISDWWPGLETFFEPGREILIARTPDAVLHYLRELSEEERMTIGERAWVRVLTRHTVTHRAIELETYALALLHRVPTFSIAH